MGEILGLGLSHAGMFVYPDAEMVNILKRELARPTTPPELREVKNWPQPMQDEWADDEGLSAARRHREIVVNGFRQLREELDSFKPDFVLIWGDDQYENFHEDVVPPFCVYAYEEAECRPFRSGGPFNRTTNVWGHPSDATVTVKGHASRWLYFVLYAPSDAEVDLLRSQLSEPDSVLTGESWRGSWRFHVATDGDLEVVKTLVSQRVEGQQSGAGGQHPQAE